MQFPCPGNVEWKGQLGRRVEGGALPGRRAPGWMAFAARQLVAHDYDPNPDQSRTPGWCSTGNSVSLPIGTMCSNRRPARTDFCGMGVASPLHTRRRGPCRTRSVRRRGVPSFLLLTRGGHRGLGRKEGGRARDRAAGFRAVPCTARAPRRTLGNVARVWFLSPRAAGGRESLRNPGILRRCRATSPLTNDVVQVPRTRGWRHRWAIASPRAP